MELTSPAEREAFLINACGEDAALLAKVRELLDNAAKKLETGLAAQPGQRAKLQATLGLTYFSLGLARQAIPLFEKVRNYCLATSGPEHPETLRAMTRLAGSTDIL